MCNHERVLHFAKGHGTRNDFVLLTDPDDALDLTPQLVSFLCDRRGGIGGDGVLRVVRGAHVEGWGGDPEVWFMDYRNADGSIAEMCGNGVRVFARHLVDEGLVEPETRTIPIGTRAGLREAELLDDGRVRVWMGRPELTAGTHPTVAMDETDWAAYQVNVGNPHAVIPLGQEHDLLALDLTGSPSVDPVDYPDGVNVEFVEQVSERHVRMRVWERGVGETESCGTGTVAVAVAMAEHEGVATEPTTWTIDVPGGTVEVELRDGQAWLTGPAVIVARGDVAVPEPR